MPIVRTAPRRRAKLRKSGMWVRTLFMPLLRSLVPSVACVATNMALLTELSTSPPQHLRCTEDACTGVGSPVAAGTPPHRNFEVLTATDFLAAITQIEPSRIDHSCGTGGLYPAPACPPATGMSHARKRGSAPYRRLPLPH
jgi:hypothetical protein